MRIPLSGADAATAPRIRQIEQVHRLIVANPLSSVASKRTAPQWQPPVRTSSLIPCLRHQRGDGRLLTTPRAELQARVCSDRSNGDQAMTSSPAVGKKAT